MKILLCIYDRKNLDFMLSEVSSERGEEDELTILNIASYDMYYLSKSEEEVSLEYIYEKAVDSGARVRVLRSNNICRSVLDLIDEWEITHVYIEERGELRELRNIEKKLAECVEREVKCQYLKV